ncbi:methylated-DNA--[protein]-cysteine S-methyltransferase [Methanospirillum sp.]|uniref:methylated-DNA--[protein]-cysteine S-methyltransferase n=1 Tax=Methanospirillum sp. TaxID=45200 RepID=UPI0029847C3B|nr:methylated-DNA--[protein]-cysteine S-methyltransferase [Methanospirillum sp.]
MMEGSIRFGLWFVYISWNLDNVVSKIRFVKQSVPGPVPVSFSQYLAGKKTSLSPLKSIHETDETTFGQIYRQVLKIPYGETRTYGEIAKIAGTVPRVVGMAMKRNMTPILIPCHRVVAIKGLGGYSPDISIKKDLLDLEARIRKKNSAAKFQDD